MGPEKQTIVESKQLKKDLAQRIVVKVLVHAISNGWMKELSPMTESVVLARTMTDASVETIGANHGIHSRPGVYYHERKGINHISAKLGPSDAAVFIPAFDLVTKRRKVTNEERVVAKLRQTGKARSEETRTRMSKALRGRKQRRVPISYIKTTVNETGEVA